MTSLTGFIIVIYSVTALLIAFSLGFFLGSKLNSKIEDMEEEPHELVMIDNSTKKSYKVIKRKTRKDDKKFEEDEKFNEFLS